MPFVDSNIANRPHIFTCIFIICWHQLQVPRQKGNHHFTKRERKAEIQITSERMSSKCHTHQMTNDLQLKNIRNQEKNIRIADKN